MLSIRSQEERGLGGPVQPNKSCKSIGSHPITKLSPALLHDPKLVDDFALFCGFVFILWKSPAAWIVERHLVDYGTRQNGDLRILKVSSIVKGQSTETEVARPGSEQKESESTTRE